MGGFANLHTVQWFCYVFLCKKNIAKPLYCVQLRTIAYEIEWEGRNFLKNVFSKPLEGLSILRANVNIPISFLMWIFWTFIPSMHFKALVWAAPRRCADHVLRPNVSNPSFHLSAHQNSHRQPGRSILVRIKSFHLSAHGEYNLDGTVGLQTRLSPPSASELWILDPPLKPMK